MVRKKKQSVYQLQTQQRCRERDWARTLKEEHSGVSSIAIDLNFEDIDVWPGNPAPKTLTFKPEQKAHFHMPCPYRECVWGGFNFSEGVREAIKSPSNEATGRVLCQGWQDEERINKHRCLLVANYKVTVQRLGA